MFISSYPTSEKTGADDPEKPLQLGRICRFIYPIGLQHTFTIVSGIFHSSVSSSFDGTSFFAEICRIVISTPIAFSAYEAVNPLFTVKVCI